MEKEKIVYNEDNLYAFWNEHFKECYANTFKSKDPNVWENTWYYDFIPNQDDEELRVCVVLVIMKYEIEHDNISNNMLDEIKGYYNAVIIEKIFDNILIDEEEREMVKKDLKWCYETAKEKGLLED